MADLSIYIPQQCPPISVPVFPFYQKTICGSGEREILAELSICHSISMILSMYDISVRDFPVFYHFWWLGKENYWPTCLPRQYPSISLWHAHMSCLCKARALPSLHSPGLYSKHFPRYPTEKTSGPTPFLRILLWTLRRRENDVLYAGAVRVYVDGA